MSEGITLEAGAKRLVDLILQAEPEHRERIALGALRAAKLIAYHENLIAARFHAGDMGQGIQGLCVGILRALHSLEDEVRDG